MRQGKLLIIILLALIGVCFIGFGYQYSLFYERQMNLRQQILLGNSSKALSELKQIQGSAIFKLLSVIKPKRYYLVQYYRGLVNFKAGNFKEALAGFREAASSPDEELSQDSKLAMATSLWLSGRITFKTVEQMLGLYADIITSGIEKRGSWSKIKAQERAYWIMARRASKKQVRRIQQLGTAQGKGKKKRGVGLKEEFKRLMKERPLEKGR